MASVVCEGLSACSLIFHRAVFWCQFLALLKLRRSFIRRWERFYKRYILKDINSLEMRMLKPKKDVNCWRKNIITRAGNKIEKRKISQDMRIAWRRIHSNVGSSYSQQLSSWYCFDIVRCNSSCLGHSWELKGLIPLSLAMVLRQITISHLDCQCVYLSRQHYSGGKEIYLSQKNRNIWVWRCKKGSSRI